MYISELWIEQFRELLNCISDTTDGIDCRCCYTNEMMMSVNEINECISRLECNKACGLDGVSAEHLKHYSSRVTPLLANVAMCITGFMVHVFFLPESMMSVVLIPIIISFHFISFHFITAQHQQADDFGRWERMLRVLFVVKSV